MATFEELRARGRRIIASFNADPTLPAGLYGDMEAGFQRGIPYADSYRGLTDALHGLDPDSSVEAMARFLATNLPKGEPRPGRSGFWTRANDFLGKALSSLALPGHERDEKTGKVREVSEPPKKFTDILRFLEFPPHFWRAVVAYDKLDPTKMEPVELLGQDVTPYKALLNFNPVAWRNAWRVTTKGETYFYDEPASDLPAVQREIAKKHLAFQTPLDIANNLGGPWTEDFVQSVLASKETKDYIVALERQQVSAGRDLAGPYGLGLEPGSKPYGIASGAIDFVFGLAAPGPDTAVMGALRKGLKGGRYFDEAVRLEGDLDRVLTSPKLDRVWRTAADISSPAQMRERIRLPLRRKLPVELTEAMAEASDPETVREVVRIAATGGGQVGAGLQVPHLYEIPRLSFLGAVGDSLVRFDLTDPATKRAGTIWRRVGARAAGRAHKRGTAFSDIPRRAELIDRNESYEFAASLLDTFPKVYGPRVRREFLDRMVAAKSPEGRYDIAREIWTGAVKEVDAPVTKRTPSYRLYDSYLKLRAFLTDPDTGEELSREMKEVAGQMMEVSAPHLATHMSLEFPTPGIEALKRLRWTQGSFTQALNKIPALGNVVLGLERLTSAIWVPLVLVTRPAWMFRVQGEQAARMAALGTGPARPREWLRSVRGRGPKAAQGIEFVSNPFQWARSLQDLPEDLPNIRGVAAKRSRLFQEGGEARAGGVHRGAHAAVTQADPWFIHGWQVNLERIMGDRVAKELLGRAGLKEGATIEEVASLLRSDPGWSAYREVVARNIDRLGGEEEYVARTASWVASLVSRNPELEDVMARIARGDLPAVRLRGKQGRKFLEGLENKPTWVNRPVSWDNGPPGLWSRFTEFGYRWLMDIPDQRLSRIPFFDENKEKAVATARSFANRAERLLPDDELVRRYRGRWEDNTRELVSDMRAKADTLERGKVSRADADIFAPGLMDQDRQHAEALRKSADVFERRIDRGPRAPDLDALALEDGFTTERIIQESAKSWAAAKTIEVFYDPSRRTWYQAQLRGVAPFLPAWFEMLETWTKIVAENPMAGARLGRVIGRAIEPEAGGEPPSVPSPLDFVVQHLVGSGVEYRSPLDSFNLFTQQMYPSTGPMVQLLAGVIADQKPEWEETLAWVGGQYGIRETRGKGFAKWWTLSRDTFLPAWLATAMHSLEDETSTERFANTVAAEFQNIMLKRFPKGTPLPAGEERVDVEHEMWNEATKRARLRFIFDGLAKSISPGQISPRYPFRDVMERHRALKGVVGDDKAMEALIDEMGEGAVYLDEPLSRADMKATKEALKLYRDPKLGKLARKFPSFFWAMYDDESEGEFDPSVYRWQHATEAETSTIRTSKFPAFQLDRDARQYTPGWVESAQVNEAWRERDKAKAEVAALVESRKLNSEGASYVMALVDEKLKAEFPHWAVAREVMLNKPWHAQGVESDLRAFAKAIPPSEGRDALNEYLRNLEVAKGYLVEAGLQPTSFDAKRAAPIRQALLMATQAIVRKYPSFRPFYTKHLRYMLDPSSDTVPWMLNRLEEAYAS